MVKDYLSFDNFDEKKLEEFIKTFPKEILAMPIARTKKYANEVGIKGFRPDSYQITTLRKIYKKEIIADKRNSYLGRHLLMTFDNTLKSCLSDEEYGLLSEKKYTSEELDKILNKLVDEKQNEKYIVASYEKKISEFDKLFKEQENKIKEVKKEFESLEKKSNAENKIQKKLKTENEKLIQNYNKIKEENTKLKEKIAELKDDNNRLNEENNSNSEYLSSLSKNDIVDQIFGEAKGMNAETINALYNELSFKNFDDYLLVIYEKKKELLNSKDFETINNVILIEYIITKLKEIEKNG